MKQIEQIKQIEHIDPNSSRIKLRIISTPRMTEW